MLRTATYTTFVRCEKRVLILSITILNMPQLLCPSLRLPDPLYPSLNRSLPQRRSRNGITFQHRPVNTNSNTLVLGTVQLGSFHTSRLCSALAGNLEVDTVGVVLGTVVVISAMQGDDFMT